MYDSVYADSDYEYKAAYLEGANARLNNQARERNPNPVCSVLWYAWEAGYREAAR